LLLVKCLVGRLQLTSLIRRNAVWKHAGCRESGQNGHQCKWMFRHSMEKTAVSSCLEQAAESCRLCHYPRADGLRIHLIKRRGCVTKDLRLTQGARRKHIRMDLRPTSNAAAGLKICNPLRLSNGGSLAGLLLSHRALPLCPFVAPCQQPAITQHTLFYLG